MKGHITKRSANSWSLVVEAGKDPETGKRRQQWHTVKGTKRDAQRALRSILDALESGTYVKPNKLTLGEWLLEWFDTYVAMHTTPRTQESYRSILHHHLIPALGSLPLNGLQPQQLQDYYSQALGTGRVNGRGGLSARSVLYHHRILSEALSHAVNMGFLVRNAADVVRPPRPTSTQMKSLAPGDVPLFLEAARETPYFVIYSTLLYTGLRRGEALALRWRNLDLDFASLSVTETAYKLGSGEYVIKEPKTPHSRRTVALPPSLALLLRQHRQDQGEGYARLGRKLVEDDLVFARPDGSPIDPNAVTRTFAKMVRKVGLPHLRLHDLRHSHATLMLKAGIHPKVVSERLGHASINITLDTYSHVLPGLQEAAADRFDRMLETTMPDVNSEGNVSKALADDGEGETRPCRARTCDTLIKSQVLCQLS